MRDLGENAGSRAHHLRAVKFRVTGIDVLPVADRVADRSQQLVEHS
jgi:hypothetical protein